MTRVVARGLGLRYPAQDEWALNAIDLDIASGEVTWLDGALGSGTSSLLLALAGLAPRLIGGDRRGAVLVGDLDPAAATPLVSGIAYLGPSPSAQISGAARTVRGEVALGPMNLGWTRERSLAHTDDALRALGVEHLADRAPGTLSGGETQLVVIAALLASAPSVWLLDEPFSALDHAATERVQRLLRDWAAAGSTVIVACDDADAMLPVADRVIVLRAGRVALDGSPSIILGGDEILDAGAGTTDAGDLALRAAIGPPRPLTSAELLARIDVRSLPRPRLESPAPPGVEPSRDSDLLRFEQVSFGYRRDAQVLDRINLGIGAGEAVGLFGANGAGKSTLLRLAMALEHPLEGTIITLGRPTSGLHPEDLAPRVAFLFQSPERQLFAASVRSECSLAPGLAGWEPDRIADRVAATLGELGLADTADQHPYDLPLPRRRLVALAAILAADPDLLLLDEPTAALDCASRNRVIHVLRERVRQGRTVLVITHDAILAHEALDRGVVLDRGRVVDDGTIRMVIDGHRMARPAALTVGLALGLPPGTDRRDDVARLLRNS